MFPDVPVLVLFALLGPPPAAPPPQDTIPATVETGLKVSIVDLQGSRVEGRVQAVSDQFVRLTVRGWTTEIPIKQIVRIERPDTVKNGALTGLIIGSTMGLIGTVVDPQGGAVLVTRTLGNGLICAGLGALIDAAVDGRKTLYERGASSQARVTPIIGRDMRAVALSIEW